MILSTRLSSSLCLSQTRRVIGGITAFRRNEFSSMDEFSTSFSHTGVRHHSTVARFKARFFYRFNFFRGIKLNGKKKKKIVILGTGWASMHFLKFLDASSFDITVISPRNYFTFTPLLPAVAAGTLSPLSCIEPVRNFTRQGPFLHSQLFESMAKDIDFEKQEVQCVTEAGDEFKVEYDYLMLGIGADTNTFGIPGVERYAMFLKEVEHAVRIRKTVMNNFERASLPSTSESEKSRLLHIVAVGGGPTGVETIAELSDFIKEDMAKYFPDLMEYVRLTLVEATNNVLPMFSGPVSQFTMRTLLRHAKVDVLLNHSVTRLRQKSIEIEHKGVGNVKEVQNISYGICIWAVGVGNTPLGKKLLTQIPEQQGHRVLKTDQQLKVIGTTNVYAMGDCKQIIPPKLRDHADYFIKMNGGTIPTSEWFRKMSPQLCKTFPQISKQKYSFWRHSLRGTMSAEQLVDYLEAIDVNYKSPTPTAQNARQEGLYLACLFNEFEDDDEDRAEQGNAFVEKWWGSLAYVGHGRAVATLPRGWDILGGFYSLPLWKALYLYMQLSVRSRAVVSFDWFKVWLCGRDVGRDHVYIPGELILVKDKPDDEDEEIVVSAPLRRAISTKLLDLS